MLSYAHFLLCEIGFTLFPLNSSNKSNWGYAVVSFEYDAVYFVVSSEVVGILKTEAYVSPDELLKAGYSPCMPPATAQARCLALARALKVVSIAATSSVDEGQAGAVTEGPPGEGCFARSNQARWVTAARNNTAGDTNIM